MKKKIKLTQEFVKNLPSDVQDALAVSLKDAQDKDDELHIIRKSIDDEPTVMPMEDEESKRITIGYASTRTVDLDNEIICPNGMDLSIFRKNPVLLWAHNWSSPPIGKMPEIASDGFGLRGMSEYADTKFATDIWSLVKGGFLKTHSVGLIPTQYCFRGEAEFDAMVHFALQNWPEFTKDAAEKVQRFITRGVMLENSVVPIPANTDALIQEVAGKGINDMIIKGLQSECPGFEAILKEAEKQANGGMDPGTTDDDNDDAPDNNIPPGEQKQHVVVISSPVKVVRSIDKPTIKIPSVKDITAIAKRQLELMQGRI